MVPDNWMAEAGPELIERVTAAIQRDPAFLREAMVDLNDAVGKYMGIDFPIKL